MTIKFHNIIDLQDLTTFRTGSKPKYLMGPQGSYQQLYLV